MSVLQAFQESSRLRGRLVIHVAGYKRSMGHMMHVFSAGEEVVCVPDRLVKAELHPVGSMLWLEEGWAVGDNPRERFCKWNWVKSMRKFHNFDEAVAYVYRLRQKRKTKHEEYTLVYSLKNHSGNESFQPISSLADIAQFESEVDAETSKHNEEVKNRQKAIDEDYPELELLRKTFGMSKAFNLSVLLKKIRTEGRGKAMQGMPISTYYRCIKELCKLGLLED